MNRSIEPYSGRAAPQGDPETRLFCTFRTAGRMYGIDAAQVREVSTRVDCTPVPQAPPLVRGLANLRSRVYLVVDGRAMLGLRPEPGSPDSRLIILKPRIAEDTGIFVEQGGDIVHVRADQIEFEPQTGAAAADTADERAAAVIAGVCKLKGELMSIVDAARLVELIRASMQSRAG